MIERGNSGRDTPLNSQPSQTEPTGYALAALPAFADLKAALDSAQVRPVTPNYQAVSDAISTNVNRALQGSLDPREALATANDAMQQALDESRGSP